MTMKELKLLSGNISSVIGTTDIKQSRECTLSAFPGFCLLFELGVPVVVPNYFLFKACTNAPVSYLNHVVYYDLLILCCH